MRTSCRYHLVATTGHLADAAADLDVRRHRRADVAILAVPTVGCCCGGGGGDAHRKFIPASKATEDEAELLCGVALSAAFDPARELRGNH